MVNNLLALLVSITTLLSSILGIIVTFQTRFQIKWKLLFGIFFTIIFVLILTFLQVDKSSGVIYTKFTGFEKRNNHYYFSGTQISNYFTPLIFNNDKKMQFRYDIDEPIPGSTSPSFKGFLMSLPIYSEDSLDSPEFERKYEDERQYLSGTLNQKSMTQYFTVIDFVEAVNTENGKKCTYKPPGWLGFDYRNEKISNPKSLTFVLDFSDLDEDIIFLKDEHKPSYKIVEDHKAKGDLCREDGTDFLFHDLKQMTYEEELGGKGIWVANIKEKIKDDQWVIVKWHPDN